MSADSAHTYDHLLSASFSSFFFSLLRSVGTVEMDKAIKMVFRLLPLLLCHSHPLSTESHFALSLSLSVVDLFYIATKLVLLTI